MYISNISKGPLTPNFSMPLVFGCSNLRTEILASYERALDGILGLGKDNTSIISQLYSQGKAPRVFSHCLKGDTSGGGILTLGEVVEPNMSYTPLIPNQLHYNINLESISINEHILKIDPTIFITSSNKGAIIDYGTTLAYFIEGVYTPIVEAITRTIPKSISTSDYDGYHCYLVTTRLNIVLKDKFFVYDLARQRIGWTNYNCKSPLPLNVSTPSSGKDRSKKGGTSLCDRHEKLIMVLAFMTYMSLILI
ncbi:putative aspartic peptidase domain, xylanase inhibitor [Lupinus albus]|uniref:Putative aspartic peptidase domain, xylanase inhibitor n=1 Tax=Lupinus albus TaxID=3870 RepID=A0A6A4Q328_LUPAL|nr:putative aspartic peptidase domain, xylanase inhibitor [Lupinus albus]